MHQITQKVGLILGLILLQTAVTTAAPVRAVAWRPDGKLLAIARGGEVVILDASTRSAVATLATEDRSLNALAWSPDGKRLAAAEGIPGVEGAIRVWTVSPAGEPQGEAAEWIGQTDSLYGIVFTPDGRSVLTCGYDRLIQKWDAATGKPTAPFVHHTAPVFGLSLSPDGKILASVAGDSTLKVWSVESAQRLATFTESTKTLSAVAFSPTGDELAAAGEDRMVRIWGWAGSAGKLRRGTFAHDGAILALAYSPDGKSLYTAGDDGRVKAWDTLTLQERHVYADLGDWPHCLAVSPDGEQVVIGLHNGKALFVKAKSPDRIGEFVRRESGSSRLVAGGAFPWGAIPALVLTQAAETAPLPRLDAVSPRFVTRGKKLTVTCTGQNLWNAEHLLVSPEVKFNVVAGDKAKPNQRQVEIDVPAEFRPGSNISFRWHGAGGTSAIRSLTVLAFPEIVEVEKAGATAAPGAVQLPATLRGTIQTRGDVDEWPLTAAAGEELSLQLLGPGLGSSLAPVMSVRNEKGEVLALANRLTKGELLLGHRFEQAGTYTLRIEDRHFTGGGNHFYAIHAGAFPIVTALSSRGLRADSAGALLPGEPAEIQVDGYNLGGTVAIPRSTSVGTRTEIVTPKGPAFNAVDYVIGTTPEFIEASGNDRPVAAQVVPVPSAVSGRIDAASDQDFFAFDARRGDRLTIEVQAGRWGSRLDSFLEILTPQGQPVERAVLRCVAETYTVLRDHDSKVQGVRLQAWDDFGVNDFLLLGGEVVKVRILPLGPDEDTKFFEKGGQRIAQFGTTSQAHALSSAAYKVEIHPPGATFPPNGMPVVSLPWANDDGERDFLGDSRILFDVPADGRYVVRLRDARGEGSTAHDYRLVVRPRAEGFRLSVSPENPNVPRGGAVVMALTAERLDGFTGPIDVTATGLPTSVTALPARIGAETYTTNLVLAAASDAPATTIENAESMQIRGEARSSTGEALASVAPVPFGHHRITTIAPGDLGVRVEPAVAEIRPGQELRFTVKIERRGDLKARIPVDVLNLPHGLRVLDVGLNGVLINEQETERSFTVVCDPWAPAGEHPFYAVPRIEARQNERHPSPPIILKVVKPAETAATAN